MYCIVLVHFIIFLRNNSRWSLKFPLLSMGKSFRLFLFFSETNYFFRGYFSAWKTGKKTRTRTTVNAGLAMEFRRDCANRRRTFSVFSFFITDVSHVFRAFSKNMYILWRSRNNAKIFFEDFGDVRTISIRRRQICRFAVRSSNEIV